MNRAKDSERTDDNLVSFEKRFNTYLKETCLVIELFATKDLVKKVV